MSDRAKTVVRDLVSAVGDVMRRHNVTVDEYRAGMGFGIELQQSGEVPLLVDVFFNNVIVDIENSGRIGSNASLQGPYFLEGAPVVEGALARRDQDADAEPLILRGRVTDLDGTGVAGAVIDLWHSTPEGTYSGIHDGIPLEFYRGKVITDADGRYECRTIMPVPYQIPNTGPTGKLLEEYLDYHSWRPAHMHYWVHADGLRDIVTQGYFEGGDYVDDDCCNGVASEFVIPKVVEDGVVVMEFNFRLDPAEAQIAAE